MRRRTLLIAALLLARPASGQGLTVDAAVRALLAAEDEAQKQAIADVLALRDRGAIAPLIQMLFWLPTDDTDDLVAALRQLTGADAGTTFIDWMNWQQAHPEIPPYAEFPTLIAELFAGLDPKFRRFLRADVDHSIRLEEIVWGGVKVDSIPALDDPRMIAAAEAAYLNDDDRVFGVALNGDARAYPLRIMNWHEMANDVVGGIPVSLPYCTLCGAGILFDTRVEGAPTALTFGSSGLLWRSNKLMYDRTTDSLWNQFTGRPVVGPLANTPIALKQLPLVLTTWAAWKKLHPDTKVLSPETGFTRDYRPDTAYRDYFASPEVVFPVQVASRKLAPKDFVFGVIAPGAVKAWPLARFAGGAVINDQVGLIDVVLVGEAETRTIRAYESGGRVFTGAGETTLRAADGDWAITEDALVGPGGKGLPRIPGHVSYWFAWDGYFANTLAP